MRKSWNRWSNEPYSLVVNSFPPPPQKEFVEHLKEETKREEHTLITETLKVESKKKKGSQLKYEEINDEK